MLMKPSIIKGKLRNPFGLNGELLQLVCVLYCLAAENRYPMKEVASTNNGDSAEIYTLPHWEDMEIYNQYPQIIINELEYQANWGEVSASQLGGKFGNITAYGWDEYANTAGEDAARHCSAAIYEIQNISAQCAVAVQYEGTSAYYAAVNNFYHPDTLGEFIEDINLKDTLIVNWASCKSSCAHKWSYHHK